MAGKSSKTKGGAFERDMCRALSLWMTDGKRDDVFWRSAMSGGRARVRFNKGEQPDVGGGDITAVDPAGHPLTSLYVIECKSVRDANVLALFTGGKTGVVQFWQQVCRDAEDFYRQPMLLLKQYRQPVLIGLHASGGIPHEAQGVTSWEHDLLLMPLLDFLHRVTPLELGCVPLASEKGATHE